MPAVLGIEEGSYKSNDRLEKRQSTQLYVRKKNFSWTYYVLGDDLTDDEDDIYATSGVPALGYPLRGCRVKSRTCHESHRVRHPNTGVAAGLWMVDVEWDSNVPEEDDDPLLKTPKISWHGETEEEVLEKDVITGDPVETAAKEPILITTPFVMPVLEIKRYETFPFDPNTILTYSHTINSAAFWGAPAGSALFLPPEVDEETIEDVRYAVATYRIKFKIKAGIVEPWQARVLHHGFKFRAGAAEEPEVYTDKHGNPATVNLNDDGTLLPANQAAKFLTFNRFTKTNFNNLTLGPF